MLAYGLPATLFLLLMAGVIPFFCQRRQGRQKPVEGRHKKGAVRRRQNKVCGLYHQLRSRYAELRPQLSFEIRQQLKSIFERWNDQLTVTLGNSELDEVERALHEAESILAEYDRVQTS